MRGLSGDDHGRLTPAAIEAALAATRWGDPHHSQPAVVSLTQPTEVGTVYPLDQLRAVIDDRPGRGLRAHLDGARLANAVVALGCSPADVTWRAGVDVLSLGATKNGALSTDAIVCFDPALREQLTYRLKRAGHVASKMRFQSAQLDAYLHDGLWLRLAATANAAMARLVAGLGELGIEPVKTPAVNIGFFESPRRSSTRGRTLGSTSTGWARIVSVWSPASARRRSRSTRRCGVWLQRSTLADAGFDVRSPRTDRSDGAIRQLAAGSRPENDGTGGRARRVRSGACPRTPQCGFPTREHLRSRR